MSRRTKLNEAEVKSSLDKLNDWSVVDGMLRKTFRFKGFMNGIAFVNEVATVAEEMDHHPDINIRFGLITISLTTHGSQGLTALDFEQAARLDKLVGNNA